MKVTFKPTRYTFVFDDNYFVVVQYAGTTVHDKHQFVACFPTREQADKYAQAQLESGEIEATYVFTRAEHVSAFYAR